MSNSCASLLSLRPDGWLLQHNGVSVRLFCDILSLEANQELAERLGILPSEGWKIKVMALESWWPRDLDEVRNLFPQIMGEDENVKLAVLALFSLKLRSPEERIMGIIIESANSAGKSYFAKSILKPLRLLENGEMVLEFTRMTGAYLERKFKDKNLDRKILFLQETENAPTQLHLTLSEGKLKVGLVERVDGELRPIEIEAEGQPFLLATTVNWRGSPDLIHRCILMSLDESKEQTFRILDFETKLASDFIYRERFEQFCEGCAKIFRKLWEETPENVEVVIPYLGLIEKQFKTRDPDVKLRRDWNKLIALLKASAILFHKHRPKLKLNERLIIISTLDDLKQILPLLESSFKQTLTNLSEKEEKTLKALEEFEAEKENEVGFATYTELAKLTGIPSSTLRHLVIPKLEAKGYVVVDRETRPHRIEKAKSLDEVGIVIQGLEEKAEKLISECIAALLLSGCQIANHEISQETASFLEKKPEGLATHATAKDPAVFSENKPGEGSVSLWQFGNGEKKATSPDLRVSEVVEDAQA